MTLGCVIVAQKPWGKKRIDDIVRTGAGALNVDKARIGVAEGQGGGVKMSSSGQTLGNFQHYERDGFQVSSVGRWPSNFALVHKSPDAEGNGGCERAGTKKVDAGHWGKPTIGQGQAGWNDETCGLRGWDKEGQPCGYADPDGYERVDDWKCVEGCAAKKLGEMSGERARGHFPQKLSQSKFYGQVREGEQQEKWTDKGTAARFYFQADWEYERMERTHQMTGGDMGKHEIICGDVIDWAKEYKERIDKGEAEPFHALLSDPPWHLIQQSRGGSMRQPGTGPFGRIKISTKGFMNKDWDGGDITFQKETWQTLAEVLHPGAFLFVFAGSRGWHRLACALEDAGLIIQPSIFVWGVGVVEVPPLLGWLQGQSFPKASRIDTQIDRAAFREWLDAHPDERRLLEFYKAKISEAKDVEAEKLARLQYEEHLSGFKKSAGMQREIVGIANNNTYYKHSGGFKGGIYANSRKDGASTRKDQSKNANLIIEPATDLARAWQGHRYGGQVLKDSLSPLVVAQKPWTNPRLDCIVETGAGAINVDGGRIGWDKQGLEGDTKRRQSLRTDITGGSFHAGGGNIAEYQGNPTSPQGRWPSNFALCHVPPHLCPACSGDGCEACDGRGVVGGCRRVGVKKVKGDKRDGSIRETAKDGSPLARSWKNASTKGIAIQGHADPDGLESVDAWECAEGCVCAKLGEQSFVSKSSGGGGATRYGSQNRSNEDIIEYPANVGYADKGTAARFFPQCGWEYEQTEMICAKDPETGKPICPIAKLDEQAGPRPGPWGGPKTAESQGGYGGFATGPCDCPRFADGEKASRYFQQSDWSHEIAERLATGDPVQYYPKAAKRERASGLDDFYWRKDKNSPIGFVRVTEDEWEALGEEEQQIKEETGKRVSLRAQGNIHPTLKPLSLIKWIATLASPPKEYAPRRILIPFCGTFSEGIGAILSGGFEEVVGVEIHEDYCAVAESRAKWWSGMLGKVGESDPKAILKASNKKSKKKKETGQKRLL